MINFHSATLRSAILHYLPKNEGINQPVYSTDTLSQTKDISGALFKLIQSQFKEPKYYSFDYFNEDLVLNPLYNYVNNTFDDETSILENSIKSAKLLFEKSKNSFIDGGYFLFGIIDDLLVDDELTSGLYIIKLEEKTQIFDIEQDEKNLSHLIEKTGYSFEKPHKICLILNINRDSGYKILQIDPKNKLEAEYWYKEFLYLKPYSDKHYFTSDYIKLTVNFAKKSGTFKEEETVEKIDLCNKTKEYFSKNEQFNEEEFLDTVFDDTRKKSEFLNYKSNTEAELNKNYAKEFEISEHMVQKSNTMFRSILKLDKNFHIYIHGDRDKIERIVEKDGTKYYKIYFETES
jgi:hypothetical protein